MLAERERQEALDAINKELERLNRENQALKARVASAKFAGQDVSLTNRPARTGSQGKVLAYCMWHKVLKL